MQKKSKTRVKVSSYVDAELLGKIRAYSEETKIPVARLLDRAMELLLETIEK